MTFFRRRQTWPAAEPLRTARLALEPVRVEHAAEMVEVLRDDELYAFTGEGHPNVAELTARYSRQARGRSRGGRHGWLTWILRLTETGAAVGFVQATLTREGAGMAAELAWLVGVDHQRQGLGAEAALAMAAWLRARGVVSLSAHIHPDNAASSGVARRLGLVAGEQWAAGERVWRSQPAPDLPRAP